MECYSELLLYFVAFSCILIIISKLNVQLLLQVTVAVNEALQRGVNVTPTLYTDKNDPELAKVNSFHV